LATKGSGVLEKMVNETQVSKTVFSHPKRSFFLEQHIMPFRGIVVKQNRSRPNLRKEWKMFKCFEL